MFIDTPKPSARIWKLKAPMRIWIRNWGVRVVTGSRLNTVKDYPSPAELPEWVQNLMMLADVANSDRPIHLEAHTVHKTDQNVYWIHDAESLMTDDAKLTRALQYAIDIQNPNT